MKQGLLVLSFSLILLAACTPQSGPAPSNTVPEQPTLPDQTGQPSLPPPTETKNDFPTPGEPDRTAFADFPTDVREILENANVRVGNGISYTYLKIENSLPTSDLASEAIVYQKGSTIKLLVNDDQVRNAYKNSDSYFDVVILDVEAKTAQGYCLDEKDCRGNTGERTVAYDDLIFPTPMYWFEQMRDPKKTSQDTIDGRSVYILQATVEDRPVKIAVDRYSGVPIEVTDGSIEYQYQKFSLGVTDAQLLPK